MLNTTYSSNLQTTVYSGPKAPAAKNNAPLSHAPVNDDQVKLSSAATRANVADTKNGLKNAIQAPDPNQSIDKATKARSSDSPDAKSLREEYKETHDLLQLMRKDAMADARLGPGKHTRLDEYGKPYTTTVTTDAAKGTTTVVTVSSGGITESVTYSATRPDQISATTDHHGASLEHWSQNGTAVFHDHGSPTQWATHHSSHFFNLDSQGNPFELSFSGGKNSRRTAH